MNKGYMVRNTLNFYGFISNRKSQVKVTVQVNEEILYFYWELGRDIIELHAESRWSEKVMRRLSVDLHDVMLGMLGLTQRNIYY